MKTKKSFIAYFLTIVCFMACTKVQDEESLPNNNACLDKSAVEKIPVYRDIEELNEIINTAQNFDQISQLAEYETLNGRTSIGCASDLFYDNIDFNLFLNIQDALNFCESNNMYLDTVIDNLGDISVYPKWYNSPYRYVANKNGLFQVGDYVTRLFKHGIATTHVNNLNLLLDLTENNWNFSYSNIYSIPYVITNTTKNLHSGCLPSSQPFADTARMGTDHMIILKTYSTCSPVSNIAPPPVNCQKLKRLNIVC